MKRSTIFIIGAGAIGRALAVFLSQVGRDVVLVRGHIDNEADYSENIAVTLKSGEIIKSDIRISTMSNYTTMDGLIVLTTKSHSNQQVSEMLKGRTGDSPVVILQNGLNVESPFLDNGFKNIYRCVIFASSQYSADRQLRFKLTAVSPIGVIKGDAERLPLIVDRLDNPYLVFQAAENIQSTIWSKAIVNCAFNSICPLLEVDNGIFYRHEKARAIAKNVIREGIVIAAAAGVVLKPDDLLELLLLISKTTDGQLISTYQDILHQRKTEMDTLNGAIAQIAEKLGKESEVPETRLLGELIKIKSEIGMSS